MSHLDALNKLCKWRAILAGWHGGSLFKDQPGCQALRDEAELRLLLRTELNALVQLLIRAKVFSEAEFERQLEIEATHMDRVMERRFPGMRTNMNGVEMFDMDAANETMRELGFPP